MKGGLYLLAVVAILAAAFINLKPRPRAEGDLLAKNVAHEQQSASNTVEAPSSAASAFAARVVPGSGITELQIRSGRLVSGPTVIKVAQGDEVTLQISSDVADELHLHGYDLHLKIPAGEPAILKFNADRSGRFPYELHHAHSDIGALEVYPR
jgi:hypothetical protein